MSEKLHLQTIEAVQLPATSEELLKSYATGERDFSHLDIRYLNIRRAVFNNSNFSEAKLSTAQLEHSIFQNTDFHGADLQISNLFCARFDRVNLRGANLKVANIASAIFLNTDLTNANFENANLQGVFLGYTNLKGANFEGAEVSYATCQRANFENANLKGANLEGIDWYGAKLNGIQFDEKTIFFNLPEDSDDVNLELDYKFELEKGKKEHKNPWAKLINDCNKVITFGSDTYYGELDKYHRVVNLLDLLRIQDNCENPQDLVCYAQSMIDMGYSGEIELGRLTHHISETARILEANLEIDPTAPYIPQHQYIQLTRFSNENKNNVDISYGTMAGRLFDYSRYQKVEKSENTNKPESSHPSYELGKLNNNIDIWAIKDWEDRDWKVLNQGSEQVKFKPIGLASDMYYAYYLTENNGIEKVIKICVYKSATESLQHEGLNITAEQLAQSQAEHSQKIESYDKDFVSSLNLVNYKNLHPSNNSAESSDKTKISGIESIQSAVSPVQIKDWLIENLRAIDDLESEAESFFVFSDSLENSDDLPLSKSKELSNYRSILRFVESLEDRILANYNLYENIEGVNQGNNAIYQLIHSKIQSKIATLNLELLNSNAITPSVEVFNQSTDNYIFDSFLKAGVINGDKIGRYSNSHEDLIRNKIPEIQANSTEQHKTTNPSLIIISESGETITAELGFEDFGSAVDAKGKVSMDQLQTLNPMLYNKIKLQYAFGNTISINNVPVPKVNLESLNFTFGNHIRFVNI
jgi:uncharacterized protein YjbI with pentapeptide repeats